MGIKHVVPVAALGLVLAGCGWVGAGKTFSDNEAIGKDITSVRFDNDSGRVKISTGDTVEVRRTVNYHGDDKPGKSVKVDGDTLVLEACPANNCSVDYEVTVPEGTKVDGQVDSGEVELTGVASANVEAESGAITVRDVDGNVNAAAQSGEITLSGIGGSVVATAESGRVSVELAKAANVTATTSSGAIEVTVPDGSYHVTAKADSGSVNNDLGDDASADHVITVEADSGDITVRAA